MDRERIAWHARTFVEVLAQRLCVDVRVLRAVGADELAQTFGEAVQPPDDEITERYPAALRAKLEP